MNIKLKYIIAISVLFQAVCFGQNVGVGTINPDDSALLEVNSNNSGLLIPRMSEAQRTAITSPATGLVVFQNNNAEGFYYFNGTVWVSLGSSSWSTLGNLNTNPATHFIGTSDLNDFIVKTNSIEAFRITDKQRIGIGTTAPIAKLHLDNSNASELIGNDFEANTILPLLVSGSQNWFTQTTEVANGSIASQSGAITHSELSVMELTYTTVASTVLNFNYATDTESCCDRLNFYIDGALQADYGGLNAWTPASFIVATAGVHTFRWEYSKDTSIDSGRDAVFVDDVSLIQNTPALRVEDGTQANNYVMASDAIGNASWIDGSVYGSSDDDWAFTSGSINSDPIHRLGSVAIGPGGTTSYDLHVYNGFGDGTEIGIGSTEYFVDRLSELVITNDFLPLNDNTASIGKLTSRWSEVYALNGVIVTSDLHLKEQILPLNYSEETLLKLKPTHYKWKNEVYGKTKVKPEDKRPKIGFLAQELKEVLPEVVEDEIWEQQENGSFIKQPAERKGVYYHEILPVVINTVKSHQEKLSKIETQNKEIEALLNKLDQ